MDGKEKAMATMGRDGIGFANLFGGLISVWYLYLARALRAVFGFHLWEVTVDDERFRNANAWT